MELFKHQDRVEHYIFNGGEECSFEPWRSRQTRFKHGIKAGETDGIDDMNGPSGNAGMLAIPNEGPSEQDEIVDIVSRDPQIRFQRCGKRRAASKTRNCRGRVIWFAHGVVPRRARFVGMISTKDHW